MSQLHALLTDAAHNAATGRNATPEPTPAQRLAGNYRLGRFRLHGMDLAIENPEGTFREGTDMDGQPWRTRLAAHYGYFAGTRGADGDPVDVFIGVIPESPHVWVVNQVNPDGSFDEHKVMLGFGTEALARAGYLGSYSPGWQGLGSMVRITLAQLRWWLKSGDRTAPIRSAADLLSAPETRKESSMKPVQWDNATAQPRGQTIGKVLYDIRLDDVGDDLLTDPMTMQDALSDPDIESLLVLDALVVEAGMLKPKTDQILAVLKAAGKTVQPQQVEIGEPVRLKGTMQIPVIYGMSDGQTLTIWFHSPDTTPAKLAPMDVLVSARWVINKKDVTIVVAPEKGKDLSPRDVARRIMALIEKNSAAFLRVNAKAGERAAAIEGLQTEIAGLEQALDGLKVQIERAQEVRASAAAKAAKAAKAPKAAPAPAVVEQPAAAPAPVEPEWKTMGVPDQMTAEQYAVVYGVPEAEEYWQDVLDDQFGRRLTSTRNAARALGWDGDRNQWPLTKGGAALNIDIRKSGTGGNIVGITYQISVGGEGVAAIRDDLSKSPDELAAEIDARAPVKAAEPAAFVPSGGWKRMSASEYRISDPLGGGEIQVEKKGKFWVERDSGRSWPSLILAQEGVEDEIAAQARTRADEEASRAGVSAAPAAAPPDASGKKKFTFKIKPAASGGFLIESDDGGGVVLARRPQGPAILDPVPAKVFKTEEEASAYMASKGMAAAEPGQATSAAPAAVVPSPAPLKPLPPRISYGTTQAIKSLNDAKAQLDTARTGLDENPNIGGGGRYESEVWQKVQGQVAKANDYIQKLRELGNKNGQIAAVEALITSLGGVPDVKPSEKALAWTTSPAPAADAPPNTDDFSTPEGRYQSGARAFRLGVQEGSRPKMIGLSDWIRGYEDAKAAEAEQPPAADLLGDAPQAFQTQPVALTPEGAESKVKTAKGTEVVTGYSVVEADHLITSHNPSTGDANPAFPAELQPRDRGRDASIAWVKKTAQNLDPDLLGKSRRADSGAPIVGPDGVVESGNGRTMSVVLAYQIAKAGDYRAWLEEEAGYFGLKPEKVKAMKRPVLVRIRTSKVDRAAFAIEANQSDTLAMTATEKAKSDARRMDDSMIALMTENGDLAAAENAPFLSAFLRTLGEAEAAQYSTSDGKPTSTLIARVQAAIFAKAYADDRLLELTADTAKPEIANIVKALNHAAPEFIQAAAMDPDATSAATGKLTDAVEKSLNQKAVDALLSASNVIRQAKDAGQSVDEFVSQAGLFGDIDPDVAAMAVFISKNNRSAKRMGEAFKAMATFIKGEIQRRQTGDMFGDNEPVAFADIVAAANRELERMYGPGVETIGLFERPAAAEPVEPAAQADEPTAAAADPVAPADPSPEPDFDPVAAVNAAYTFDKATDDFKALLADSIDATDYSEFATAKAFDQAVKAAGGTVSWSLVVGAILDSVAEMSDGWEMDEPSEYEGIFDSVSGGEPQGVIRKGAKILGRAVFGGDGKAMIYVGKAGADRVLVDGRRAIWGEEPQALVSALFSMAATPTEPKVRKVSKKDAAKAADQLEFVVNDLSGKTQRELVSGADIHRRRIGDAVDAVEALKPGWPADVTFPQSTIEAAQQWLTSIAAAEAKGDDLILGAGDVKTMAMNAGVPESQWPAILANPASTRTSGSIVVPSYRMGAIKAAISSAKAGPAAPVEPAAAPVDPVEVADVDPLRQAFIDDYMRRNGPRPGQRARAGSATPEQLRAKADAAWAAHNSPENTMIRTLREKGGKPWGAGDGPITRVYFDTPLPSGPWFNGYYDVKRAAWLNANDRQADGAVVAELLAKLGLPAPAVVPVGPAAAPVDAPRNADAAFLRSVIDKTAQGLLDPATADEIEAIMGRHPGDAEIDTLAGQAIDAYMGAAMEATAGLK